MKKLILFILTLCFSTHTFADGGIPLLAFMGSNLFITGNFVPPFFLGFFLFGIVCFVEKLYLSKKLHSKEKISESIIKANALSTLVGIPLTVFLYLLCPLIPCQGDGCLMCAIMGPLVILEKILPHDLPKSFGFIIGFLILFIYVLIFWWLSWFVEYRYLRKKLNNAHLKKYVIIANILSYLIMFIAFPVLLNFLTSFL